MRQAIQARQLFTLAVAGETVHGTYHVPCDGRGDSLALAREARTGILFLNSLSLPRASTGDSAVFWADAFARSGYPSFRIDLPGMGDSSGVLPPDLLTLIANGGYAEHASSILKQIVAEYALAGMVIFGLCAGATTAIYSASATRECKGVILLDPSFFVPAPALRPRVRRTLSDWAARSSLGGTISNFYDRWKSACLRVRRSKLPANANRALLARWKALASKGVPILLLRAPAVKASGATPRVGEFDYLKHAVDLAGANAELTLRVIDGADHPFSNQAGRAGVREQSQAWLTTHFPLPAAAASVAREPVHSHQKERDWAATQDDILVHTNL